MSGKKYLYTGVLTRNFEQGTVSQTPYVRISKGNKVRVLREEGDCYVVEFISWIFSGQQYKIPKNSIARWNKQNRGKAGSIVNSKHKPPSIPKGKGKVHKKVKNHGIENGGKGKEQAQGNGTAPPLQDDEKKDEEPHFSDDKKTIDSPPKKEHKFYKINRRPKDDIDSDYDNETDNETRSDQEEKGKDTVSQSKGDTKMETSEEKKTVNIDKDTAEH